MLRFAILGLGTIGLGAACAPAALSSASDIEGGYKYALTLPAAQRCRDVQERLSAAKQTSDATWSRYHKAMALTWDRVADGLGDTGKSTPSAALRSASIKQLAEMAKPCEVLSRIHEPYSAASFDIEESDPILFADNAARKFQTGGEPAELPRKQITFDAWEFEARGNSCLATHTFEDGATLRLGMTNFFDGAITFEWDELPSIDVEADDYEEQLQPHGKGSASDEDTYARIYAQGFNYANFPGTAIFVDRQIIASMNPASGNTSGTRYVFGEAIQKPYYNTLPAGKMLTIKVLGKETHRLNIDDPAFWNEMSNCMAQYPFG